MFLGGGFRIEFVGFVVGWYPIGVLLFAFPNDLFLIAIDQIVTTRLESDALPAG